MKRTNKTKLKSHLHKKYHHYRSLSNFSHDLDFLKPLFDNLISHFIMGVTASHISHFLAVVLCDNLNSDTEFARTANSLVQRKRACCFLTTTNCHLSVSDVINSNTVYFSCQQTTCVFFSSSKLTYRLYSC